jgi:hypothetical protein
MDVSALKMVCIHVPMLICPANYIKLMLKIKIRNQSSVGFLVVTDFRLNVLDCSKVHLGSNNDKSIIARSFEF